MYKKCKKSDIEASKNGLKLKIFFKTFHCVAAMVDIDEFILPSKNSSSLLQFVSETKDKHPSGGNFVFQNVFHYIYWENGTSNASFNLTLDNKEKLPYLLTQTKVRRTKTPHKHGTRSKYVTRPDKVETVGNHLVWKLIKGKLLLASLAATV